MTGLIEIDVEAFWHWTIARQRADVVCETGGLWGPEAAAAGLAPRGVSADGCVGVERQARLGSRVQGSGVAAMMGHSCDPDAEAAYTTARRVFAADMPTFFLILSFARSGERPGWGAHKPELDARTVLNGELRPLIVHAGGKRPYCLVEFYDRRAEIDADRLFYRTWWVGLRRLAGALRAEAALRRHRIAGPGAPERPWLGEAGGDRVGGDGVGRGVNLCRAKTLDFGRDP